MTDYVPIPRPEEPQEVEPEIVGFERPAPAWRRALGRLVVSLVLGACGVAVLLVGGVLTLSIVGAPLGIPLLLVGLVCLLFSAVMLFGGGRVAVVTGRR